MTKVIYLEDTSYLHCLKLSFLVFNFVLALDISRELTKEDKEVRLLMYFVYNRDVKAYRNEAILHFPTRFHGQ